MVKLVVSNRSIQFLLPKGSNIALTNAILAKRDPIPGIFVGGHFPRENPRWDKIAFVKVRSLKRKYCN